MSTVRSFIYLDEHKLYSYSSQIFEGLTEYIVSTRTEGREQNESGTAPLKSDQILADIFSEHSATEEKRFLFDHAYKLMEDRLIADGAVLDIDRTSVDSADVTKCDFVRIKGSITFNDVRITKNFVSQINSIGEAITYVTNYKSIAEGRTKLSAEIKDKSKLAAANTLLAESLRKLAEQNGLHHDPKFMDYAVKLLDFGFEDQFEIRIQLSDAELAHCSAFSAILKRQCLREAESMLVRKYGRKTEREFTLFGVVVQAGPRETAAPPSSTNSSDSENLRAKLLTMVDNFVQMDEAMSGRSSNEVFVDPIAVYLDVRARAAGTI